jgi:hypothetical protein
MRLELETAAMLPDCRHGWVLLCALGGTECPLKDPDVQGGKLSAGEIEQISLFAGVGGGSPMRSRRAGFRAGSGSGVRRRRAVGEVTQQELLKEGSEGTLGDTEQRIGDGDLHVFRIAAGVVEGGDEARGDVAEDVRIVGLEMTVVSLTDGDGGDGIQSSNDDIAVATIEVTRVLVEDGGIDGRAEERGTEAVAVTGGVALGVASEARAVAGEVSLDLLDSSGDAGGYEGEGILRHNDGQFELLTTGKGRGIGDVTNEEVGEDAKDALVLLGSDLLLGEVLDGDGVDGGGDGFDAEFYCRDDDAFAFVNDEDVLDLPGGEALGGDGDDVGAGWNGVEEEAAVWV